MRDGSLTRRWESVNPVTASRLRAVLHQAWSSALTSRGKRACRDIRAPIYRSWTDRTVKVDVLQALEERAETILRKCEKHAMRAIDR